MILRGDIYIVESIPSIGHEQCGRRPCVIVSNDSCNMYSEVVEIVLLSTSFGAGRTMPTHVQIHSALKPSVAKCESIISVDKSRLGDMVGKCTIDEMRKINFALMISLGIGW